MNLLTALVCGAIGGGLFRFGAAWWRNRRDAIEWHEWCDRYPDSPVALVERVWPTKRPRPLWRRLA
jgi:hypothetical protein